MSNLVWGPSARTIWAFHFPGSLGTLRLPGSLTFDAEIKEFSMNRGSDLKITI